MIALFILQIVGLSLLFIGNLLISDSVTRWGAKSTKQWKFGNIFQSIGFIISLIAIFLTVPNTSSIVTYDLDYVINHYKDLTIFSFLVISGILSLLYLLWKDNPLILKISGYFVIIALVVLANHWAVYIISLFILGVPVTNENYLKSLIHEWKTETKNYNILTRDEKISPSSKIINY